MKVLLIVLAVIVGLPVYSFIGFLVFIVADAIAEGPGNWRWNWREDSGMAMLFLMLWPVCVAAGIIALPIFGMYHLICKLSERGE